LGSKRVAKARHAGALGTQLPRRKIAPMRRTRAHSTQCQVCRSEHLPAINLALANGLSQGGIAERFALNHHAIHRHQRDHLPTEVRAALALRLLVREGDARSVLLEEGASTVSAITAIRAPLYSLFLKAVDIGDSTSAARLAARLHEGLSLSAKLAGDLLPTARTTITNIVISEDYQRLRGELLQVLRRYPEAQRAVADVFRRTGERAADEMQGVVPRPMIEAPAVEVADHAA